MEPETVTRVELPGTMQARPTDSIAHFESHADDFVMEPKYDGFRMLAELRDGEIEGWSRGHKVVGKGAGMRQMLPHVHSWLSLALTGASVSRYTVIDGELYVDADDGYHAQHHSHVASVMKSLPARARSLQGVEVIQDEVIHDGLGKPLTYFAFDLLFLDGEDIRGLPWERRRSLLEQMFPGDWGDLMPIVPVKLSPAELPSQESLDRMLARGVEGCIIKEVGAPYRSWDRPRDTWWKYKVEQTADVVCMGFTDGREGKGVRNMTDTIGAIRFGQYVQTDEGLELRYRGRARGITDELSWRILGREAGVDRRQEYVGRVFEIRHNGIQNPGFRHPRFLWWRDDKSPEECTWD